VRAAALVLALIAAAAGCLGSGGRARTSGNVTFMVHASELTVWRAVVEGFARTPGGVGVSVVEGPNATELRENLYTTSLLAGDDAFDLVYMDVTWTSKFAAAGWLLPLDADFPASETAKLLPAALEAGRYHGTLYRVPVRTDVGLLYYRKDLLDEAGLPPPATFEELVRASRALERPPQLWGFVFQGSQYEGLVCGYLEVLHGHGGFWVDPATLEVGLDRPEAVRALEFLRACAGEHGISPAGVIAYKEDESRRLFQDGRAVFLRSWPFVWRLAQREDSKVRGRIGVVPMVHATGVSGGGTLGGWGFGISRSSRRPDLALKFLRYAVSLEGQRALCASTGYAPALVAAYDDAELLARNPLLPELRRMHDGAVARPAIPRYAHASDILQRHVSAALAGLDQPPHALAQAAAETRLLLGRRR